MTKEEVYDLIEENYRDNFKFFTNRLSRFNQSRHNAEDIIQEAYTRALQYWKAYNPEQEIGQWIHGIIGNSTRDFFRAESVQGMGLDLASDDRIDGAAMARLELTDLLEMFDEQPWRTAKILKLFFLDQFSVKEIEQIVPESGANIRKIVQRFREEIRNG